MLSLMASSRLFLCNEMFDTGYTELKLKSSHIPFGKQPPNYFALRFLIERKAFSATANYRFKQATCNQVFRTEERLKMIEISIR